MLCTQIVLNVKTKSMGVKASSVLFFEKSLNLGNVVYPLQCEQKEVDLCKEYASCFMLLRLLHTLSAKM